MAEPVHSPTTTVKADTNPLPWFTHARISRGSCKTCNLSQAKADMCKLCCCTAAVCYWCCNSSVTTFPPAQCPPCFAQQGQGRQEGRAEVEGVQPLDCQRIQLVGQRFQPCKAALGGWLHFFNSHVLLSRHSAVRRMPNTVHMHSQTMMCNRETT